MREISMEPLDETYNKKNKYILLYHIYLYSSYSFITSYEIFNIFNPHTDMFLSYTIVFFAMLNACPLFIHFLKSNQRWLHPHFIIFFIIYNVIFYLPYFDAQNPLLQYILMLVIYPSSIIFLWPEKQRCLLYYACFYTTFASLFLLGHYGLENHEQFTLTYFVIATALADNLCVTKPIYRQFFTRFCRA